MKWTATELTQEVNKGVGNGFRYQGAFKLDDYDGLHFTTIEKFAR